VIRAIRQSLAVGWAGDICLYGDCSTAGGFDQGNRLSQLWFPTRSKREDGSTTIIALQPQSAYQPMGQGGYQPMGRC
jgi:hypothetical protein